MKEGRKGNGWQTAQLESAALKIRSHLMDDERDSAGEEARWGREGGSQVEAGRASVDQHFAALSRDLENVSNSLLGSRVQRD